MAERSMTGGEEIAKTELLYVRSYRRTHATKEDHASACKRVGEAQRPWPIMIAPSRRPQAVERRRRRTSATTEW